MYLIEYITKTRSSNKAVLASPQEVFELLWVLDNSQHVVAWKPIGFYHRQFGWSDNWNKMREVFTTDDFAACSG